VFTPPERGDTGELFADIRACNVVESEMEAEMESCVLTCTITFQSAKPISFTENIIFEDDLGNR